MSLHTLVDGPEDAPAQLILAHGAGAPMDSVLLTTLAGHVAHAGVRVVRFEFPYMAARRSGGGRRPPNPTAVLLDTWRDAVAQHRAPGMRLFVGGHSMGGRMATMVAEELRVDGVCAVSYPWHPPGKPQQLRTAHLEGVKTRMLLVCGTLDEFGTSEEVSAYSLSPAVQVHWLPQADHSLRSKRASGHTLQQNLRDAAAAMVAFMMPQ